MKHLNTYRSKRRGVTIELALVVMMLVFALGTILVSTALIQNSHKNNRDAEFTTRADLDNITNDFLKTVREDLYTSDLVYGSKLQAWALDAGGSKYEVKVDGWLNNEVGSNRFDEGDLKDDLLFKYVATEGAEPQTVKATAFPLITLTVSDDATDELLLTIELTLDQEKSTVKPAPQEPAAQAEDGETVDQNQNQNQNDPATTYVIADSVYTVTRWTYH